MAENFSPTPWSFQRLRGTDHVGVIANKHSIVIGTLNSAYEGGIDTMGANGNLMAAAPELLAACETMVTVICDDCGAIELAKEFPHISCSPDCKYLKVRAIIAKAQGEV